MVPNCHPLTPPLQAFFESFYQRILGRDGTVCDYWDRVNTLHVKYLLILAPDRSLFWRSQGPVTRAGMRGDAVA